MLPKLQIWWDLLKTQSEGETGDMGVEVETAILQPRSHAGQGSDFL